MEVRHLGSLQSCWPAPLVRSCSDTLTLLLSALLLLHLLRAVLLAEVVAHYFPKLVELHNYRYADPNNSACNMQSHTADVTVDGRHESTSSRISLRG